MPSARRGQLRVVELVCSIEGAWSRRTMVQLAWLWLRDQPSSDLSRWFHQWVGNRRGKIRRITVVAVARKLLIALWRLVTQGVVPVGAEHKV